MKQWTKILGVILVLALVFAFAGCKDTPTATTTQNTSIFTELERRIAAVETTVGQLSSQAGDKVSQTAFAALQAQVVSVQGTIAALQAQVNAIQQPIGYASQSQLDSVNQSLTAANAKITALEAGVADLQAKVAALQSKDASQDAANAALLAELNVLKARVAALETPPTTPPTTTPAVTAAQAIQMSVVFLGSLTNSQDVTTTDKTYYVALNYKNTANQQFTGVKYQFALLMMGITFDGASPTANELKCYTVPISALTIWTRVNVAADVWTFTNFQGLTAGAKEEGTLLLEITIDSNTAGSVSLALAKVL